MYIEYKWLYGHYNVYVDGKFYCSCDNMDEVRSEIAQLNV